jgi:UDP-glucose 4-epimerase
MGRRVLVTGIGTFWGGRVAQALERDPDVETIVGLGVEEPTIALDRTDQSYSILARIVRATQVDTVLHTFLVVDSTRMSGRQLQEINVIGTMNLLAAAGAADSPVRTLVVKSSTLVYGTTYQDPTWWREDMGRVKPPTTRVERSLLEVEGYLRDFAEDNPHVCVSLLRFANVLGTDIETPITKALQLPLAPSVFGFDPLLQFVHEDDVVSSIEWVMRNQIPGVFNVAGDGKLPWSEVAAMCDKRLAPLPPVLTNIAAAPLGMLGLVDLPPELLDFLRYGRGADNRRLKDAGFKYEYTSSGAVDSFAKASRLRRTIGDTRQRYRYERDVEAFFRHSPAVVRET